MGRATSEVTEANSKMKQPFRYANAEIRTRVVVICGPTRYQLDHGSDNKKCHTMWGNDDGEEVKYITDDVHQGLLSEKFKVLG